MEIEFSEGAIKLDKELNLIDQFVTDACKILGKHLDYVIVSGYLSILFGKIRGTEDVDVFAKKTDLKTFKKLCADLKKGGFEIFNAKSDEDAYDMLTENAAPRISRKGEWAPNVELKFAKEKMDFRALEEKKRVVLNGSEFFISPIEQNIAFKIYLGSRKDIDDACHLYILFKRLGQLDEKKIEGVCRELGVSTKILERCGNA